MPSSLLTSRRTIAARAFFPPATSLLSSRARGAPTSFAPTRTSFTIRKPSTSCFSLQGNARGARSSASASPTTLRCSPILPACSACNRRVRLLRAQHHRGNRARRAHSASDFSSQLFSAAEHRVRQTRYLTGILAAMRERGEVLYVAGPSMRGSLASDQDRRDQASPCHASLPAFRVDRACRRARHARRRVLRLRGGTGEFRSRR